MAEERLLRLTRAVLEEKGKIHRALRRSILISRIEEVGSSGHCLGSLRSLGCFSQ